MVDQNFKISKSEIFRKSEIQENMEKKSDFFRKKWSTKKYFRKKNFSRLFFIFRKLHEYSFQISYWILSNSFWLLRTSHFDFPKNGISRFSLIFTHFCYTQFCYDHDPLGPLHFSTRPPSLQEAVSR